MRIIFLFGQIIQYENIVVFTASYFTTNVLTSSSTRSNKDNKYRYGSNEENFTENFMINTSRKPTRGLNRPWKEKIFLRFCEFSISFLLISYF
jgi:hypothetical protein